MSNTLPGRALDIPVPPQLEAAVEYHGTARYFGLYWTLSGDEVVVTDGRSAHDGCWWGYQAFVDHPLSLIPLAGQHYHLGSSDEPATHWLIIDRQTRLISMAPADEALRFLNAQHPPLLRTQLTADACGWRSYSVSAEIIERARCCLEFTSSPRAGVSRDFTRATLPVGCD